MNMIAQFLPRPAAGPVPRGLARNGPAILSYGFRPFFLGAGMWAIIAMLLWIGSLIWGWPVGGAYGATHWHGHEMLFGYTGAALAGFMLTAIPNWTGRLPVSGKPLLMLALIWLAGRLGMLLPDTIGLVAAIGLDVLFFPVLALIAAREIGAGQSWKNAHVVIALTGLTAANLWYHWAAINGDPGPAYRLAISIWTLLIALIGGRLAVSFTRNWLARKGETAFPASFGLFDRVTLMVTLITLLSWVIWPEEIGVGLLALAAATLHAVRLGRWKGWKGASEALVLVLHTAYGFIPLGLAAIGLSTLGVLSAVSALHLLTVGAIANMTLAVMTRATRGHTGRPLTASRSTALSYLVLSLAALLRPLADFWPDHYLAILALSGGLWLVAYGLFVIEHAPMLLRHRPA